MTNWESSEDANRILAERREAQLTQRFLNRQEVVKAIPSFEAFMGEGGLEPPQELVEEAGPTLHRFLGEVAGHHLGKFNLVELRHPLSGVVTQISIEQDRIMVAEKEARERFDEGDGQTYLSKLRLQEQTDGSFKHSDVIRVVEDPSEFQHSPSYDQSPVTRMEMVSLIVLLIESDVIRRDE